MDVELLVVPDCPSEGPAAGLLRVALDDIGLSRVEFQTTVVISEEDAVKRRFTGSPTFLIDGVDPFAGPLRGPSLACRLYEGPDGPAGVPQLPALRQALKRRAAATVSDGQS